MNSIPMVLVAFELPRGIPPETEAQYAKEIFDRYPESCPWVIDALHVLGLDREDWADVWAGFSNGRLRETTQSLLRLTGSDGEDLIRREAEFHFIWADVQDKKFGTVRLLYVVPVTAPAIEAGLCLGMLQPKGAMN
jgi:hypothetical protein